DLGNDGAGCILDDGNRSEPRLVVPETEKSGGRGERERDFDRPSLAQMLTQTRYALANLWSGHPRLGGDGLELLAVPLAQHPIQRFFRFLALGQRALRPAHQVVCAVRRACGVYYTVG